MGEAKRRHVNAAHNTLDGGPPSGDRIGLEMHFFSPTREAFLGACMDGDQQIITTMRETYQRMHRRPTPICSACDYEFGFGEWPPLVYCTRPAFPKADAYKIIIGAICRQCAVLPADQLNQGLIEHFKAVSPSVKLAVMQ